MACSFYVVPTCFAIPKVCALGRLFYVAENSLRFDQPFPLIFAPDRLIDLFLKLFDKVVDPLKLVAHRFTEGLLLKAKLESVLHLVASAVRNVVRGLATMTVFLDDGVNTVAVLRCHPDVRQHFPNLC